MVILWNTQYYNKIEIREYTNNKYYDVSWFFKRYNLYLLKDIILVSHIIVSFQDK